MKRFFNLLLIDFAILCLNCVKPSSVVAKKQLSDVRYTAHDLQHNI